MADRKSYLEGAEVRAIRTGLSLSQTAFAELLGIGQSTVSDWERTGVSGVANVHFITSVSAGLKPQGTKDDKDSE